jgi:hypothetical protein
MLHHHERLNTVYGQAIHIFIPFGAHVLVLDDTDYAKFCNGSEEASRSRELLNTEVSIPLPHGGWWNVVVHFDGQPLEGRESQIKVRIEP